VDECADVVRQPDGSYVADARAKIELVVGIVGHDFDIGDAAEEVDTLGGYLVTRAGRLPLRGELIPGPGLFEFEVLDADPRRVKRVRIRRLTERREKTRDMSREQSPPRKRAEPDAVLAGTAPPTLDLDEPAPPKNSGATSAGSSADKRRS
jgi:magnesium and cobalt transporter